MPINDAVQKELCDVRDELGLTYVFPWEEGYAPYPERETTSHIENK